MLQKEAKMRSGVRGSKVGTAQAHVSGKARMGEEFATELYRAFHDKRLTGWQAIVRFGSHTRVCVLCAYTSRKTIVDKAGEGTCWLLGLEHYCAGHGLCAHLIDGKPRLYLSRIENRLCDTGLQGDVCVTCLPYASRTRTLIRGDRVMHDRSRRPSTLTLKREAMHTPLGLRVSQLFTVFTARGCKGTLAAV